MMKILSLLLSFTLIFTSVAPAAAQTADAAARQKARVSSHVDAGVDRAVQSQRGKKFAVKDKAAEVRAVVKAMGQGGSEKLSYKDFAAEYKKEMKNLLVQVMGEAKTDEERAYIKQVWTAMMTEKAIRAEYKQYQKLEQESLKEAEKEVNAYLRRLGREVMAIYKVNKREGLALIKEALPVFASVGAIEFNVKKEAAGVLRQAIKAGEKSCGSVGFLTGIKAKAGYKDSLNSQVKGCQSVLEAAYALSVLGADDSKGQSADAKVLGDLLAKGYNGLMGPSLIVMVSKGLLAMHGERTLTAELVKISRDFPDIGLFGNDFSFISVADWVKASSIMKGEYAMGMEYSFYKGGKYANLNNAWLDLGQYLAQEAKAGDKSAAYVLNTVMEESVWYDSYGNPGVKFKPFVTGALAGGYRINKPGRAYTQLDGNGKTQHIDTRKEWNRALAKMKKLNMTQSGYFASSLYYSGKGDLDPYTNIYINNKLVDGYRLSGSRAQLKNFGKRARPTAAELRLYKELQHAQTVGNVIDVALAVFFMGKLALSAVKMGVQGIKSGVRVLKLARSGAAANGLGFGKNFSRVIRLGRLQKYGVHSAKELLRSRLSGVMGTQHTKIVGGVKNFRQAEAAKKAADAKRAAAAQAKADAAFAQTAEVRSVDGVAHVIPSGMDLVRVNGRPVLVKKGLSFSEIAKNFGVAESAVSEAKAGSSMAAVSAPRYTTSGAAAAVEGKVQPAMGPKPVAAEVAEPVGTKGSVVKSPVRYVQVETTNALGNKVMSWKPVTPEIAKPKPSFWKNFKERFLWNWYGLTDFAGSLGQAAQNGRSSGVLALGLNMGSVPMQAVKAEASLLAQGVKTEHVLTLKNMVMYSDELAKVGWSGASFRVGTPNVGGMQNMGRLPQVGSPFGATGPALGMLGTLNATNIANNLSDSRAQAAQYTATAVAPRKWWQRWFGAKSSNMNFNVAAVSQVAPLAQAAQAAAHAEEPAGEMSDAELGADTEHGFKMTYVDESGKEQVLPVNVKIEKGFKADGYNRITFTQNNVAELRNQAKSPKTMAHFFMKLKAGELPRLVAAAQRENIQLQIKLESSPNVAHKTVEAQLYAQNGAMLPVKVELPASLLKKGSRLVMTDEGRLGMLDAQALVAQEASGRLEMASPLHSHLHFLNNYYVRMPKHQIGNWVKLFKNAQQYFDISVLPTQNKAQLVVRDVSLTNVSLGKTMAPIAKKQLGMSVDNATTLMFIINYILPGLASLVNPVLKKYGEKKLLTIALGMSAAAGLLATAAGFYGFVENQDVSNFDRVLFVSGLVLMSASSILKQLVCNMLIRANRGEVSVSAPKKAAPSAAEIKAAAEADWKDLTRRVKEFFTKPSDVNLKDVVLYNLSFVFKNVGTLAFLASPYAINWVVEQTSGINLGLDYSVSFPIYALYSTWVTYRVMRSNLRDAYSAKNLEQSQRAVLNHVEKAAQALEELFKLDPSSAQFTAKAEEVTRKIKESLDDLTLAQVKLDSKVKSKEAFEANKAQALADLEKALSASGALNKEQVKQIMAQVNEDFTHLGKSFASWWKVLKEAKGVKALSLAMTLATVHEFILSSSFATSINKLVPDGAYANFLVALCLYVPFIVGRLGGNMVGKRISSGSMYILCSALSAIGTAMMITNVGNLAPTMVGAVIASLGVGNFFTQMYDYIMQKHPKLQREISVILALTMAVAGLATLPASYLTSITENLDLIYAGACLGLSLVLTPGMMKDSTLFKFVNGQVKKLFGKKGKAAKAAKKDKHKGDGPASGAAGSPKADGKKPNAPKTDEPETLSQVFIKNQRGDIIASLQVPVAQAGFQLKPLQEVFILPSGEMILREYRETASKKKDAHNYTQIVVRDDIRLEKSMGKIKASALNLKKIGEGLLLANSKIWPMFLMYVLLGMNNVSTIVANFAEDPFHMSKFEMFLLGNMGTLAVGLFSLPIGILQGKFSRRAMSNIGMLSMIAAFAVPWLAGLNGTLGDATDLKRAALMVSFVLMGIGGAFLDVSLKPTVLAVSKKGNYQRNVGTLAVFKQVFGNSMNYLLPPLFLCVAGADWSAFFPVYMAGSVVAFMLYNKFRMKEQTLDSVAKAKKKYEVSFKSIWNLFTGKNKKSELVRKSVYANILHGANIGTLALFVNSLMKEHFEDPSAMWHLPFGWTLDSDAWVLPSFALFTLPIIFGRMAGTALSSGFHIGNKRVEPLNAGTLLQASAWISLLGILLINMPSWPAQELGAVLAALGLTNFAPILTAFPTDKTRDVSNEVSALLSFSSVFSAAFTVTFGLLLDVLGPWSAGAFGLLGVFFAYLIHFGKEIRQGKFDDLKDPHGNTAEAAEAYEDPLTE
mgnify:FL=1